jgi:ssDNA-binding Zn-finger/Zn-ribbon topoisomerase 1
MRPSAVDRTPAAATPACPDGHGPMVRKDGRTGAFYSCTAYPACRRTAPVLLDLPCPQCGAPLVVRTSRKTQQPFTGCSTWPACAYVAPGAPHTCGSCGKPCLGAAGPSRPRPLRDTAPGPADPIGDDDVPF